ncbi:MAG: energy-coupling factor transporter transmembrane protein EcfT [Clostridiales Family XIII bacterium]|jgi:energy-coupling factor transport system permease protein|nr:energy-coupling factor transporter transmembrane protein EcfT [Clostridiales Family XIII bacterium]
MTKKSRLGALDPRPKLMLMASASTACILANDLIYIASVLCMLIATLLIGGMDVRLVLRRAKAIFVLIAMLFVIQTFFSGLPYPGGLLLAAMLSLRLLVVVLAGLILMEGEVRDYLLALVQMKMPYTLAFMVVVGLHFLPILREEAVNIYCCMQLRGKDFKNMKLTEKVRAYTGICLPILVGALRRADEMSVAMETRGFRSRPSRTYMRQLKMRGADIALTILWPAILVVLYEVECVF